MRFETRCVNANAIHADCLNTPENTRELYPNTDTGELSVEAMRDKNNIYWHVWWFDRLLKETEDCKKNVGKVAPFLSSVPNQSCLLFINSHSIINILKWLIHILMGERKPDFYTKMYFRLLRCFANFWCKFQQESALFLFVSFFYVPYTGIQSVQLSFISAICISYELNTVYSITYRVCRILSLIDSQVVIIDAYTRAKL